MTRELATLLKNEKKNKFLFYQLYYHPEVLLKFLPFQTEDYYKVPGYYELFLNNGFLIFLNLALKDETFFSRLNENILLVLSNLINDQIYFRYDFLDFPSTDSNFGCGSFVKSNVSGYRKWDNQEKEDLVMKVEAYYQYLAEDILNYLAYLSTLFSLIAKRQSNKMAAFEKISQNRFFDKKTFHLGEDVDVEIMCSLVCDNDFVDLIGKMLKTDLLDICTIKEAKDIISYGIKIKKLIESIPMYQRKLIGEDKIKVFDISKAEKVLNQLILYFYTNKKSAHIGLKLIKSGEKEL